MRYSKITGLIVAICLMLFGYIHPCPGPHHFKTPGEAILLTEGASVIPTLQVCSTGTAPCVCAHHSNSLLPLCLLPTTSELSVRGGESDAEVVVVPGLSVGEARKKTPGPRVRVNASDKNIQRQSIGVWPLVSHGRGSHDHGIQQQSFQTETISSVCSVTTTTNNVNRKMINPGIAKNRKWAFFHTVNHSKIIWDPKTKPKGILGRHLNIRSILSKTEQINHLLLNSNLDYLCLSETWLYKNTPSAALNMPGYNMFRRDREAAKGGGVMIYIKK